MKRAGVVFVAAASLRAIRVSLAQTKYRERESNLMKNLMGALTALLLAIAPRAGAQLVENFDDITYWAGLGESRSALVLQWNDGGAPVSLAWGYRWDGTVSGIDMLKALAGTTVVREPFDGEIIETLTGADSRLSLVIERYDFGDSVYSIDFREGAVERTRGDWDDGYWEYYLYGGNFEYSTFVDGAFLGPFEYDVNGNPQYAAVDWFASQIGASDRLLVDGSWDAWSFAAGFVGTPVEQPVAVPEPRALWLLVAAAVVVWMKGRFHARARL
jgi:hypothetical protein